MDEPSPPTATGSTAHAQNPNPHPSNTSITTTSLKRKQSETANAHTSTTTASAPSAPAPTASQVSKKRKKRDKSPSQAPHILHASTYRKPLWMYFHLRLLTPDKTTTMTTATSTSTSTSTSTPIDSLTISTLLTPPLKKFLGQTGAAIPIDILHSAGRDVYIRVPRQDARAVRAGLSGWMGVCNADEIPSLEGEQGKDRKVNVAWRVVGEAGTLMGVLGDEGGEDLFGGG